MFGSPLVDLLSIGPARKPIQLTLQFSLFRFSRSRLQGCSCHRGKDKELEGGGSAHLRHGAHHAGHQAAHKSAHQGAHHLQPPGSNGHHTVKMFAVQPGQFQLRRSHKNVIVNPLPGTLLHQPLTTGGRVGATVELGSRTDLVEPINQSAGGGGRELDELDEIESGGSQEETEEPIYAEIKPSQGLIKLEKILKPEQESENPGGGGGKKKEVEYWQITAKEVVKFRPCTETFIQRE